MAILKGFPPSNTISPSVRIAEKDLSFIAPEQSTHNAGLIGFASKGPINLPVNIATSRQLHTIFGNPHPDTGDPFLIYAADQYLLVANTLYVVRVADTDPVSDEQALTATVDVPAAGTIIEIESATSGPYTFDEDSFFRWKLNGSLSSKTLVVLAGTYAVDELVTELNNQLDFQNDGIKFYESGTNTIAVKTMWAYGPNASLEMVSIQNAIYGGSVSDPLSIRNNPTGLGTGMTRASVTGSADRYPANGYTVSGHYDLSGFTDPVIEIVLDGTDNVLIDDVVQTITFPAGANYTSISDVVNDINDQKVENGGTLPGGWTALASGFSLRFVSNAHGSGSRLRIKPTSVTAFGLSNLTTTGTSPEGETATVGIETYGLVTGGANVSGDITFTLNADSPGIDGNLTQVVISNDIYNNKFSLAVYNDGVQVESWGGLTKDDASRFYVETYLALVSDYVRAMDNTAVGAGPANGTYTLSGGTDGIPSDPDKQDVLLMGSPLGYTGIYTLSEPEQVNIEIGRAHV